LAITSSTSSAQPRAVKVWGCVGIFIIPDDIERYAIISIVMMKAGFTTFAEIWKPFTARIACEIG